MSISLPDDPRPGKDEVPEGFEPVEGIRYLVHGNLITILDDRPWNTSPEPLTDRQREQLRKARRRLEGLPEEEPPQPPNS